MAEQPVSSIAERIHRIRTTFGLTQVAFARLLGVSNVTVNRWERGHSRPESAHWTQLERIEREGIFALQPPSTEASPRAATLSRYGTSFIGRDNERTRLISLLKSERLVTLTGPGGAGKTRLAIETARLLAHDSRNGVSLVELAPLADSSLLAQTVARAIGVPESPVEAFQSIVAWCESKELVILLDNCEHLLPACADLAAQLLDACPQLRILATSRAPLDVAHEALFSVSPLTLPSPSASGIDDLLASEAVKLFVERARTRVPSFGLTERNASTVAAICQCLDGLPLAIEMAAARIPILTPAQIEERLEDRFRLLRQARPAVPRHRTLEASVEWGFDLLDEDEKRLFERISIFAGRFDLNAAEAIFAVSVRNSSVLDLLAQLHTRSMIMVDASDGLVARYSMLETLRAFARERLLERGLEGETARAHADYFLRLVESAEPELSGPNQGECLDRLEADEDNLRSALAWALTQPFSETALRFTAGLWRFWSVRGRAGEGRIWMERTLQHRDPGPPSLRAMVLNRAGNLANDQGDHVAAPIWYRESLELCCSLGDRAGAARALANLGIVASMQGDYPLATNQLKEALALAREIDDPRLIANALHNLAVVAEHHGDYTLASDHYLGSQAVFQALGDNAGMATVLNNLGNLARGQGDHDRAEAFYEEALSRRETLGDAFGTASCLHNLGVIAGIRGEHRRARDLLERSLGMSRELGNQHGAANSLAALGTIAADRGETRRAISQLSESLTIRERLGERAGLAHCLEALGGIETRRRPERAARLLGAAEAQRDALRIQLEPTEGIRHERHHSFLGTALGPSGLRQALGEGSALPLTKALAEALAVGIEPGEIPATRRRGGQTVQLTNRQVEVLRLMTSGMTNVEIAVALGISRRTVEHHLTAIYTVAGVERRAGAIAFALSEGFAEPNR